MILEDDIFAIEVELFHDDDAAEPSDTGTRWLKLGLVNRTGARF